MKFSRLFSSMLVGSVAVGATIIACGGSTPKKPDGKVTVIDSPGSGSGSCAALASYSPSFGSNQSAVNFPATGSSGHFQEYDGALGQGTLFDLQLYAGFGGFGSGDIKTGTFPISGSDAAYSTCGICPAILADVTATGSGSNTMINIGAFYTADSGSVTLTSVTGTLTGSLSNVHFIHVGKGSNGGPTDTAVDSCTSMIASGSFSATLQMGSAAFNGDSVYEGTMEDGQPIRIHLRNQK